jgi:hypothetical protein
MRRMPWIACVWPGLPQLWVYGSWSGLAVAVGAAVAADALLLVSFGWTELVGESLRNALWVGFGACWVVSAAWSVRQCRRRAAREHTTPTTDAFAEALEHYLKGDYYQAEQVLEGLLRRNPRDLDARLMLATLLRHTGRLDDAARQLETLARFDGAEKWELEIGNERHLLTEMKKQAATAA